MWKNYFKTSFRYLLKNRFYTLINIFSLTVGISVFTVIALLFQTKTTPDFFHQDANQIYRIVAGIDQPTKDPIYTVLTSESFAPELQNTLPSVQGVAQYGGINGIVKKGKDRFHEQFQLVSPNFFKFFNFPFKEGKSTLDSDHNTVVLSEDTALKYFGNRIAIGEFITLKVNDFEQEYKVCGVLSKQYNSKIELDIVIPNVYSDRVFDENVNSISRPFESFIKLEEGASFEQVQNALYASLAKEFSHYEEGTEFIPIFQSLKVSSWAEGIPTASFSITPLYVILSLAFIILLISCINFSTLSIGNAFKRTKEVGVRKVNGAYTSQLKLQFLIESLLTSIFAGVISLPIINRLIFLLNDLVGMNILFSDLFLPNMLVLYVSIVLFSGLFAGLYPAFKIARFNTQNLLRNKIHLGGKNTFSNILITTQFAVSLFFVVLAALISKQVYTFENADTGFNKEQIVLIENPVEFEEKSVVAQQFFELVKQNPNFSATAASEIALSHNDWNYWPSYFNEEEGQYYHYNYIDENFIDLYQIEIESGEKFSIENGNMSENSVLVNQVFVERYKLENPVGNIVNIGEEDVKIVGVVKDFHFRNLKQRINPLILRPLQQADTVNKPNILAVKIAGDVQENIAALQKAWSIVLPDYPFEYSFVEEEMNQSYIDIAQVGMIASFASTLVSCVALLGLFGLIVLVSNRRTKEIAIRKVIGAEIPALIWTLSKNLLKLVFISVCIALPLATFFFSLITEQLIAKVPFNFFFYLLITVVSLFIAMVTMGIHTLSVSIQNPVKSLRDS